MRTTRPMPLLASAIASIFLFLFSSSSPSLFALADNVAVKLPAGASPGTFMPFVFGGVHTQKEKSPAYLEEVTEPRYVVEVSSVPEKKGEGGGEEEGTESAFSSPAPPSSSSSSSSATEPEAAAAKKRKKSQRRTVSLADRAGRPFECSIPAAAPGDGGDAEGNGAEGGANSPEPSPSPSPLSLLRSLEGACLYRIEDSWWTFELCFERHVRQFHREGPGGVSAEFWLGKWGSSGGSSSYNISLSKDRSAAALGGGEPSFVSSFYGGGDPCDLLNGKPRRAEVRFVCHEQPAPTQPQRPPAAADGSGGSSAPPQQPPTPLVQPPPNVILSAKEHSTCSYEIVVGVNALCGHRGFKAEEPATSTIECRPVL